LNILFLWADIALAAHSDGTLVYLAKFKDVLSLLEQYSDGKKPGWNLSALCDYMNDSFSLTGLRRKNLDDILHHEVYIHVNGHRLVCKKEGIEYKLGLFSRIVEERDMELLSVYDSSVQKCIYLKNMLNLHQVYKAYIFKERDNLKQIKLVDNETIVMLAKESNYDFDESGSEIAGFIRLQQLKISTDNNPVIENQLLNELFQCGDFDITNRKLPTVHISLPDNMTSLKKKGLLPLPKSKKSEILESYQMLPIQTGPEFVQNHFGDYQINRLPNTSTNPNPSTNTNTNTNTNPNTNTIGYSVGPLVLIQLRLYQMPVMLYQVQRDVEFVHKLQQNVENDKEK